MSIPYLHQVRDLKGCFSNFHNDEDYMTELVKVPSHVLPPLKEGTGKLSFLTRIADESY